MRQAVVLVLLTFVPGFNPRICKRCDFIPHLLLPSKMVSIHASVKDATHFLRFLCVLCGFNPRICKRCDYAYDVSNPDQNVSIHASVKDATDEDGRAFKVDFVSIHASVKDATAPLFITLTYNPVSIHASVKDATLSFFKVPLRTLWFQSTHL